jgi:hypothetical protein
VVEIEWKGAIWKAAYGNLSMKDLLTVLKGYGPMEILQFAKPGCCRGHVSLCLSPDGNKEVTVYNLEVEGEKRSGRGRAALFWLKQTFKGAIYVDYPEPFIELEAVHSSLPFWLRMFREGLVTGVEYGAFYLYPEMSEAELNRIEKAIGVRS